MPVLFPVPMLDKMEVHPGKFVPPRTLRPLVAVVMPFRMVSLRVGLFDKTLFNVPVEVVTPVPPFRTGSAVPE